MAEGWSIESDGLRYQIVTWHPRSVQAVADDIRSKAERGSALHIKARRVLAAQKIIDAAAGR